MTTEYMARGNGVTSVTVGRISALSERAGDKVELTPASQSQLSQGEARHKRRDTPGWTGGQIAENGIPYRHRKRVALSGNQQPLIDVGPNYTGPVPPAYGDGSHERFLDEIVYHTWHGTPRGGWRGSRIIHIDGDSLNCAPANLDAVPDSAYQEAVTHRHIKQLMRSDTPLKSRTKRQRREWPESHGGVDRTLFIDAYSDDLAHFLPKQPIKNKKEVTSEH